MWVERAIHDHPTVCRQSIWLFLSGFALSFVVFNSCSMEPIDFRLQWLGDYSLERSCEFQIMGISDSVWVEPATASVSIPSSLIDFQVSNPPNYVPENALPLHILIYLEAGSGLIFPVWLSPDGSFKYAELDPHNLVTGSFSSTGLEINTSNGGLGSAQNCSYY